jgi:glucose-1-phosphatase
MITTLIFDFGGVIMDLKKKRTVNVSDALSELTGVSVERIKTLWKQYGRDVLINKLLPIDFLKIVLRHFGLYADPQALLGTWNKLHVKEQKLIDWKLVDYIQKLRKSYKVYILSNTFDVGMHGRIDREMESLFDGIFLSYKEGVAKPDKEAYLSFCRKIKASPQQCILIDDSRVNIESASILGMDTLFYTDFESFKKELEYKLIKHVSRVT